MFDPQDAPLTDDSEPTGAEWVDYLIKYNRLAYEASEAARLGALDAHTQPVETAAQRHDREIREWTIRHGHRSYFD